MRFLEIEHLDDKLQNEESQLKRGECIFKEQTTKNIESFR